MALTTAISRNELERVAVAAYGTKTLRVMLCTVGGSGFTENSTVAQWQTRELAEQNGYVRFSAAIATGQYSAANSRYEFPVINASFTASGSGFNYDRVVLYIDGATNVHSVLTESPNIVLQAGQTQTYRLTINTDD
jgi:hypothetical protein